MDQESENYSKDLLKSLKRLQNGKKFCDFLVKFGDQEFYAHRYLLSAASPYFEAMLSHDTLESQQGWVEISGLSPIAVHQCIKFIYSGKATFSLENPEELIQAADLMQLGHLAEMYFKYLSENTTVENCFLHLDLAQKYNNDAFEKIFHNFVLKNIDKIVVSDDFSKRTEKEFLQCLNLLPENQTNRDLTKWKAIVKWVNGDLKTRKEKFEDLFKLINLDYLPHDLIKDDILSNELIKNSHECKDMILKALCARPVSNVSVTTPSSSNVPVGPYTEIPTSLVVLNPDSSMLHKMNISDRSWSRYLEIPKNWYNSDIASIRGQLYVRHWNRLMKFTGSEWIQVSVMKRMPKDYQCLVQDELMWFVEKNRITKYNSYENSWEIMSTSLALGDEYFCAISPDRILAMGGKGFLGASTKAYEFLFSLKEWKNISDMTYARTEGTGCFFKRNFYVFGGYTYSFSARQEYSIPEVESYTPAIDRWTVHKKQLPSDKDFTKAFPIGTERIILVGSCSGLVYSDTYTYSFEIPPNDGAACAI